MSALATAKQASHLFATRRKALRLSQADVATRLGISQSRYSELEAAPERITLDRLITLTALLGLEIVVQDKSTPSRKSER